MGFLKLVPITLGAGLASVYTWKCASMKHKANCEMNLMQKSHMYRQQCLLDATNTSKKILTDIQESTKCPGISVCVSVNGETVWKEGLGYADLESQVACSPHTVMKVASLSKPITMAVVAKMWERGALDLDADVHQYVSQWPQHTWGGQLVRVTARQLASHMSGVRNYKKLLCDPETAQNIPQKLQFEEYHITKHYKDVNESLGLFINDKLLHMPGTKFHYSNHGYTLLSAVLEGATGHSFPVLVSNLLHDLGMTETYIQDKPQTLMYNRSRHYIKTSSGDVLNAPFSELSFKLAGAGMWSSAIDMVSFGNVILYSYQHEKLGGRGSLQGYLSASTVNMLWAPIPDTTVSWDENGRYGMGWQLVPYGKSFEEGRFLAGHTGTTVDASSAFVVLPCERNECKEPCPKGVVVAILSNMQGVPLGQTAVHIAKTFEMCVDCKDK